MSELFHYASKYYDPQKAHEYYEAHKELKGRKPSTAGLTSEGKQIASYVKTNINAERKAMVESERNKTKYEIDAHCKKAQFEAAKLRILLESENGKNDPAIRNEAKTKIKSLVDETKKQREDLLNKFKEYSNSIVEEYEKKYEHELGEIAKEYTAQKTVKTKKTSSTKRSTKSTKSTKSSDAEITPVKKPVAETSSSSGSYTKAEKTQTSKWAINRAKRKAKALKHSDILMDERINDIINSRQTVEEILERNNKSDNRIADLDDFIQSL